MIGGTGMLGRPVVERLAQEGQFRVRVLSRTSTPPPPDHNGNGNGNGNGRVEYVQGSVLEKESLFRAMNGCIAVHLNLSGGTTERRGAEQVAQVAPTISTLRRITMISGISTNAEQAERFPTISKPKWEAEQAIVRACRQTTANTLSYTIFRCTMFLETLPNWRYLIGSQTTQWHWLAARDYARMVSYSYRDLMMEDDRTKKSSAANRIFVLRGLGPSRTLPEALFDVFLPRMHCQKETLERSSDTMKPSIMVLPRWYAWLLQWLPWSVLGDMTPQEWSSLLIRMDWLSQIHETIGDAKQDEEKDYYEVLGGPPTITMEAWIDDYLRRQQQQRSC